MSINHTETPAKKKCLSGRKPLPKDKQRKLITARVSAETYQYVQEQNIQLGLLIDQMAKFYKRLPPDLRNKLSQKEFNFDLDEYLSKEFDPVIEQARGLLAMMVERGTSHLTEGEIEMLGNNFSLIVNNFTGTFKPKQDKDKLSLGIF
jgi:hypothetical protein